MCLGLHGSKPFISGGQVFKHLYLEREWKGVVQKLQELLLGGWVKGINKSKALEWQRTEFLSKLMSGPIEIL